jgi:hypothetical protein
VRPAALTFLAALVVVASAAGSVSGSAINRATFDDAPGEDPEAPDITAVEVSNDEDQVTFRVVLANRPELREDLRVSIYVDADNDVKTGLLDTGMEYYLLYDVYLHGEPLVWRLGCWESTCAGGGVGTPKIPLGYDGGPSFTIARSDLANTRRFRFVVAVMDGVVFDPVTRRFDLTNAHRDTAPDGPPDNWRGTSFFYDLKLGPSKLLVRRFSTTPAKPVAGKTFLARLKVKRDDSGAFVTTGKVACKATVGRAHVRVQKRGFAQGAAFCRWNVPENASGALMRGSIGLTFSGKTAKKSFALKVS